MDDVIIRRAELGDADAIADLQTASRKDALPYLPDVHTDDETREWVATIVLPTRTVWVAEIDGQIAGIAAWAEGYLEQLYMRPGFNGRGIGSDLLARALAAHPDGIKLWAFQRNTRARDFYEQRGFVPIQFTNGADNEEREPDVLYEWKPADQEQPAVAASPATSARQNLLDVMRTTRRELKNTVAAFNGRLDTPLGDDWTAGDALAHIAVWERMSVRKITGAPLPIGEEIAARQPWHLDTFNHAIRELWRSKTNAAILTEFATAYEAIVTMVENATEADCAPKAKVWHTIDEDSAGHYHYHFPIPDLMAARWPRETGRT